MNKIATLFLLSFLCALSTCGQDTISVERYRSAVGFMRENLIDKKVFNLYVEPNWFPDSSGVWYIHHSPGIKKYLKVTFPDMTGTELFDHEKMADLLSDSLDSEMNAYDLPIRSLELVSPVLLKLDLEDKSFLVTLDDYSVKSVIDKEPPNPLEALSPDSSWVAYSEDYNLYLRSTHNDHSIKQLSTDGKKNYEYASWYGWGDIIKGENGERPQRFAVDWSDDGEWIYTNICDLRSAQKMYLLDWSIDSLYRPQLLSYYRGSPGDTGMVYLEPVFFNVKTGKLVKPNLPRSTHINAVSMRWSLFPGKVYLMNQSRGYKNLYIHTYDLKSDKMELLYTESSSTNIDNFTYELAEKSNLLFFLSEKSGWRQIHLLELDTGKEQLISGGGYYIHRIVEIDEEDGKIFFVASGKEKDRNPYFRHLYSMSFDGSNLKILTPEDRNHRISLSPDYQYIFDNFSTVTEVTHTVLRSADTGAILKHLSSADLSQLEGWKPPESFTVEARDGRTALYGVLWKPTDFDPNKKYPLIERSYTGPHTQVFPRDFSRAFDLQSLAELGFAVMVVDGLGSSGRSKSFHNYSYKNLGGNLEDHVLAIRQLGRRYSWIDTSRVGIFGHSAGGYDAAHALLKYPATYKVAVASSADHDHRMEKAWWPEMYMGWPVDSVYHLQSNITMAGNLKGKLLITHGGIDENVNPSATFKLAEALIKADKEFDMLILPSQRHGYRDLHSKYFTKVRWNYFIEHLSGLKPLWNIKWE